MEPTELADMKSAELVAAWAILTRDERLEAFRHLSAEDAAEFFPHLDAVDQAEILQHLPQSERSQYLALLPPDDLADVFQELDARAQSIVFKSLAPEDLAEVKELAAYDWDDAGGVMTPDFAHILPDMTVDNAIVSLRLQLKENPETIRYVYVLERDGRLAGVVSFRALFGAPAMARVRELMEFDLVTVREETDQEEVANLMRDQGLAAIPVVDANNRIKGIITSDDVIAIMEEEATEDIHKLAAVAPTDIDYARAGVLLLWRRRAGWLLILLVTGTLTSLILEHFQSTLERHLLLVFFIPLLNGTGGNTGTQSAMLVIRSLATGDLHVRNWFQVLLKEILVGVLLALMLATLLGFMGFFRSQGQFRIALVLGATMMLVVLWANLVGATLPLIIRAVRLDPAIVSAPLISTLIDISAVTIYFTLASLILS
ncbi:MAG: magnesium transporter [Gemmatimonadetes bacterium]|nr:magnesium transporter [Gemmatimonadota bacterium]